MDTLNESIYYVHTYRPNSPGLLTDNWKVTDDSSVNFHDVFFFIFCYNLSKNEEKHIMEIYGWVVCNFPVVRKWTRWIQPLCLLIYISKVPIIFLFEKAWFKLLRMLLEFVTRKSDKGFRHAVCNPFIFQTKIVSHP